MLYYVDHTSRFDRNTGIQRCVRSIAKALLALQVPLRPVVWNRSEQDFVLASPDALQHLSRWSGPEPEDWALETPHGVEHPCDSWLLIVELVSGFWLSWSRLYVSRCVSTFLGNQVLASLIGGRDGS